MCIIVILVETTSTCRTHAIRIGFVQPGLEHRDFFASYCQCKLLKISHLLQKAFVSLTMLFFFFFLEKEAVF